MIIIVMETLSNVDLSPRCALVKRNLCSRSTAIAKPFLLLFMQYELGTVDTNHCRQQQQQPRVYSTAHVLC